LKNLTHIFVDGNPLQAPLPEFNDANFPNLQLFLIDNQKLVPDITKTALIAKNNKLDLRAQGLSHIPAQVFDMISLTELDLCNNHFTVIPPEIGKLTNLTCLKLSGNMLTQLPEELKHLKHLTEIHVDGNKFPWYHLNDVLSQKSLPNLRRIQIDKDYKKQNYINDSRVVEII
jgi:Leucine-rich repeat (LRR) protein